MNTNLVVLRDYVMDVLGNDIADTPVDPYETKSLPLILKSKYAFHKGNLAGQPIILMFVKGEGTITADELRKHVDLAYKVFRKRIIYITRSLEGYNRKRLIRKKISFIVPGKQMFIPDMMIDLQDFAMTPKKKPDTMSPAVQYLLLYHLLVENLEGLQMKVIAKKLGYGSMTITRAAFYLSGIGVCRIEGTKEKSIVFGKSKQALWQEVEPLMSNPVKKIIFVSNGPDFSNYKHSNINALAHYTAIANENKDYFAITDQELKKLKQAGVITDYGRYDGEIGIEIWKYDPDGLSKVKYIDQLSLYLVFREDDDERIQMVLNQMMEEFTW